MRASETILSASLATFTLAETLHLHRRAEFLVASVRSGSSGAVAHRTGGGRLFRPRRRRGGFLDGLQRDDAGGHGGSGGGGSAGSGHGGRALRRASLRTRDAQAIQARTAFRGEGQTHLITSSF